MSERKRLAVRVAFRESSQDPATRIRLAEAEPILRPQIMDDLEAGTLSPEDLVSNGAYATLSAAFDAKLAEREDGVDAFRKALYDNDLPNAKRLATKFGVTAEDVMEIREENEHAWGEGELLPDLAHLGYAEEAEWLVNNFRLLPSYLVESGALINAAGRGHSSLAKWLIETTGAANPNLTSELDDLFGVTAGSGDLELLQWLIATLSIEPSDLALKTAFGRASEEGAMNALKWLEKRYHPDRKIIVDSGAFHGAIAHKHFDVADWLAETYTFTFDDAFVAAGFDAGLSLKAMEHSPELRTASQKERMGHFATWLMGKLGVPSI